VKKRYTTVAIKSISIADGKEKTPTETENCLRSESKHYCYHALTDLNMPWRLIKSKENSKLLMRRSAQGI
jgi:hypothetical protein